MSYLCLTQVPNASLSGMAVYSPIEAHPQNPPHPACGPEGLFVPVESEPGPNRRHTIYYVGRIILIMKKRGFLLHYSDYLLFTYAFQRFAIVISCFRYSVCRLQVVAVQLIQCLLLLLSSRFSQARRKRPRCCLLLRKFLLEQL